MSIRMTVSLRQMFMVLMCVGIALSAADAQELICNYICAAGSGHSHVHDAEAESTSHEAKEPGKHHEYSPAEAFLSALHSSHRDCDCASINTLVIATSDAPGFAGSHVQTLIVIEPVVGAMAADPYLAASISGSPPYRAAGVSSVSSVSLRI